MNTTVTMASGTRNETLLYILRSKPGLVSDMVYEALPAEWKHCTPQISVAIVVLVWLSIFAAIVHFSRKTVLTVKVPKSPSASPKAKTPTKSPTHHYPQPAEDLVPEGEMPEASIKEEEPEDEERATRRSSRKSGVQTPSMLLQSPMRLSARSIKTPERFSPGGKMLDTNAALRPGRSGRGAVKNISFD